MVRVAAVEVKLYGAEGSVGNENAKSMHLMALFLSHGGGTSSQKHSLIMKTVKVTEPQKRTICGSTLSNAAKWYIGKEFGTQ